MKQEDLLNAMNAVDDAFLEDAHAPVRKRRILPKVLVAAALAAALTITAAAAGLFSINLYTDHEEAENAMQQEADELGQAGMWLRDSAPSYSGEEAEEICKADAEWHIKDIKRRFEILTDEQGGATWDRRLTYEGGALCTAGDLATLMKNDAMLCLDISYMEQNTTPIPGSVVLEYDSVLLHDDPLTGEEYKMRRVMCIASYTTKDGGVIRFSIGASENLVNPMSTVYAEKFEFDEEVKSADGVQFRYFGTGDGRVDAMSQEGTVSIHFIGYACDREMLRDIIEHCYFADMIDAINAEYLITE